VKNEGIFIGTTNSVNLGKKNTAMDAEVWGNLKRGGGGWKLIIHEDAALLQANGKRTEKGAGGANVKLARQKPQKGGGLWREETKRRLISISNRAPRCQKRG